MKLLLDMGLASRTADYLRALGHDADHVSRRGMEKSSDEQIMTLAAIEVDPHRVRVRTLPIW